MGNPMIAAWGEPITVSRTAAGTYPAGVWTPGAPTTIQVVAVVIPLEPAEIAELDLGEHVKQAVTLYTDDPLNITSETARTQADRLAWSGSTWELHSTVRRNQLTALVHYKSTAIRVEGT